MTGIAARRDLDVAIVGGGPAGLAAAVELRRLGVQRILVLEREPELGGIPRDCHHLGFGWLDFRRIISGPSYARRWTSVLRRQEVESWTESSVTRWRGDRTLEVTSPRGVFEVSASAVVLATGCRERPRAARLVPGSRPAGVLTTGALQRLVHGNGQRAGRRAVVVGAEHVSFSAVHTLTASGTEVAAIVTDLPRHQSYRALAWLTAGRYGVPVLTDSTLARITGRARVEAVEVAHRVSGEIRVIDCDTVVFTGDWIPDHELARSGGLSIDPGTRGPQIDARFRTSAVGVFAAGNVLHGAETAGTAALEGRACAASVVAYLRDHAWWTQPALPVLVAAPLRWIAPNALMPGEASRRDRAFVARTAQFLRDGAIEVRQGDRVVHRSRFRELVPNCSIRVDGGWMRDIAAAAGAVIVSARPRAGNGVAP